MRERKFSDLSVKQREQGIEKALVCQVMVPSLVTVLPSTSASVIPLTKGKPQVISLKKVCAFTPHLGVMPW